MNEQPLATPLTPQTISPQDRRVLYNRFSVMKAKAKKNNIPFNWHHFSHFLDDLLDIAPSDYSPGGYRVTFDPDELHPDGMGYCRATLEVYKTDKIRYKEATSQHLPPPPAYEDQGTTKSKPVLISSEDAAKLSKVSAHLVLILQELDGDAQLLVDLAMDAAENYKAFESDFPNHNHE